MDYGFTLGALGLNPSDVCNIRVYVSRKLQYVENINELFPESFKPIIPIFHSSIIPNVSEAN
jgi:hypothetical protein